MPRLQPQPKPIPPKPKLPETKAVLLQPARPTPQRQPPLPLPPPLAPTPPAPPSPTSQPYPTANPAPLSQSVLNTLEKLRSLQQQQTPPRAEPNPAQGEAPQGGGNPLATDTHMLTVAERGSIGDHVRPCWTKDVGAPGINRLSVLLIVTTGRDGVVHQAVVAPPDLPRYDSDPVFRAFADRAVDAVLDYRCAALPLPGSMLGQPHTFLFRFRP